jgi:hypothetical protein
MSEGPFEACTCFIPLSQSATGSRQNYFIIVIMNQGAVLAIPPKLIIANDYYFGYFMKLFIYLNISGIDIVNLACCILDQ